MQGCSFINHLAKYNDKSVIKLCSHPLMYIEQLLLIVLPLHISPDTFLLHVTLM